MKKRMLLPLIFLLTFTLWLTPTPAAEEWVLHKKAANAGGGVVDIAFSPTGSRLIVGTVYNDTEYNVQVYNGNTFEYIHGKDYTDSGERDRVWAVAYRPGWYEAAIGGAFRKIYFYNTLQNSTLHTLSVPINLTNLAYSPDGKRLAASRCCALVAPIMMSISCIRIIKTAPAACYVPYAHTQMLCRQ